MPELARFFGIVVSIFFGDHNPPHVHVSHGDRHYTEWAAQVTIRDGKVLDGYVPPRDLKLIKKWLKLHQDELLQAWADASEGKMPKKIQPLRVR